MTVSAQGLVAELVRVEQQLTSARAWLAWLAERGAATRADFDTYNAIAGQILSFELVVYGEIVTKLRALGVPDALVEQVPRPEALGASPPAGLAGARGGVSVADGNDAESLRVHLGAVKALPLIGWVAIIVALVVSGVVVWKVLDTIGSSIESNRILLQTAAQLVAFITMLRARAELYASCIRSGRTPQECARITAQTIPEAPVQPAPVAPSGIPQWVVALAVVGGAALVTGGVYTYVMIKRSRRSSSSSGSGIVDRAIGTGYQLEVE